jgi:hypothetical protein
MNYGSRLQCDIAAMLAADEKLHYVQVIYEGDRSAGAGAMLFEASVEQALAGSVPVNGKVGLCVLIFSPEGKPESRANTGLITEYELTIRVVENKADNANPTIGTGITCEDMLVEVMLLLQMWTPLRGHPIKVGEFYKVPLKDQDHLWAWECIVTTNDAQAARPKCSLPKFDGAPIVTITTATDGAAIYYTTDGTLPTPATNLYAEPLDIEGPATIRAMAWSAGHMPSDCAQTTL